MRPCEDCNLQGLVAAKTYCSCDYGKMKQRRYQEQVNADFPSAGVPKRLKGCTVDGLLELASAAGKEAAIAAVRRRMESDSPRGLMLHGPNGVGKTGLLVSLAKHIWWKRGQVLLWIKYTDLINDVQGGYGDYNLHGIELSERRRWTAQRVPHLFLDDFGDPFRRDDYFEETEDRRKIIFDVLAARHEAQRPTYLSANFAGIDELAAQFDPRTSDRIEEMCEIIEMAGANLRRGRSK